MDLSSVVCSGKGFSQPPSLPSITRTATRTLGFQRNRIASITLAYLSQFVNLRLIDLSDQDVSDGCVTLDFDPTTQSFEIQGKK